MKNILMAMALWLWLGPLVAAELPPAPAVVVAQSEQFEAVGRLLPEGLVWWLDQTDSNAPVLNARLEVEFGGQSVTAQFRPEQGDYLIAAAPWLQTLRSPGRHELALTVLVGQDGDLLTGSLQVLAPEAAPSNASPVGRGPWLLAGLGLALVAVVLGMKWRRRGGV